MPSVVELAAEFGTATSTAQKASAHGKTDGLSGPGRLQLFVAERSE